MAIKAVDKAQLPKALKKKWKGSQVYVASTSSAYIVKKVQTAPTSLLRKKLKRAGKSLSSKTIAEAVRSARS